MAECAFPRGCVQWVLGDDELCEYHAKIRDGLIDATPRMLWSLDRAAVVSDEQLELALLLQDMGASDEVWKRALTQGGARKGA